MVSLMEETTIINVDESGISNGFGGIVRICLVVIRNSVLSNCFITAHEWNLSQVKIQI